jgi:hypothetical protein
MAQERGIVRAVAWQEACPALCLFKPSFLAADVRKVFLAVVGWLLTSLGWWGLGYIFLGSNDPAVLAQVDYYRSWPWEWPIPALAVSPEATAGGWLEQQVGATAAAGWTLLERMVHPFVELFQREIPLPRLALSLLCAAWELLVWTVIGGLMTRLAGMQLTQEMRSSFAKAWRHVRAHWRGYLGAPLFPFVGVLLALAPMSLAGLLTRWEGAYVLAAIGWPMVLIVSFLVAILLVGLLFGWPLMWTTISIEGGDSFDGLNRLYAYVYQRPFHLGAYALASALLGIVSWLAIGLFAGVVLHLAAWGASWAAGPQRASELFALAHGDFTAAGQSWGAAIVAVWVWVVQLAVLGYGVAYFWTAATAIYLLLRRDADGTPMDDILPDEMRETPLPALTTDESGVPVVAEEGSGERR